MLLLLPPPLIFAERSRKKQLAWESADGAEADVHGEAQAKESLRGKGGRRRIKCLRDAVMQNILSAACRI